MDLTENGRTIPEEFIKKSFKFLLERESKDSILRQFNISQINDFFPAYERDQENNAKQVNRLQLRNWDLKLDII